MMRFVLAPRGTVYGGLWLVVVSVILNGCASSGTLISVPEGFPNHSAEEVSRQLPTVDSLWTRFRADLSIAYSSPQESGSVTARVEFGDSILVRFRAPLGIEVSRALITGDSIYVYDRVNKRLFVDARDGQSRLLPAALTADNLAASLFGFDKPTRLANWTLTTEGNYYRMIADDSGTSLLVDPSIWRVVSIDVRDDAGMIVEQRRYTEFERLGGSVVPRRFTTSRPGEDTRASVFVRRLDTTPGPQSFELGVPENVPRILVR